jgi:predicted metal-binding membrane protein
VLLFGSLARRSAHAVPGHAMHALLAGYLAVWMAFSLGATALQRALATTSILSPMMEVTSTRASAVLLLAAGLYQFTPLKNACLRICQSPLGFLMTRWRSGTWGAFRMGVDHGVYCVGCCWALMLLLFAGGVMNLTVIVALTAVVAIEKLARIGVHGAQAIGVVLIAAAMWMLAL